MRIGRFPLRNDPFQIHKLIHGRYNRYSTVKGDLGIKFLFPPLKMSFKNLQQLQPIPVTCRSLLQISRLHLNYYRSVSRYCYIKPWAR